MVTSNLCRLGMESHRHTEPQHLSHLNRYESREWHQPREQRRPQESSWEAILGWSLPQQLNGPSLGDHQTPGGTVFWLEHVKLLIDHKTSKCELGTDEFQDVGVIYPCRMYCFEVFVGYPYPFTPQGRLMKGTRGPLMPAYD